MTMTRLEKLLDATRSQHGFWLINHVEYIKDDLEFLLRWHGGNVSNAAAHLDDTDSDFTKKVYAKIAEARDAIDF